MGITTISKQKPTTVTLEESYALAISFPAEVDLVEGIPVKFDGSGLLVPVANDGSDLPLGIVTRGNKTHVFNGLVTVLTPFKAVLNVKASGAVTQGAAAIFDEYTEADGVKYKVGTGNAVGVFLGAAADGEYVEVGVYKNAVTVA